MIKIGALYKRQGKNGEFLAGKFGDASIMIFPNKNKTDVKQPDYEIIIAENKQKPAQQGAPFRPKPKITPRPQQPPPRNFAPPSQEAPPEDLWDRSDAQDDSEIPF